MPDFTPGIHSSGLPCSLKTLTKSQPFNLNTDARGAEKQAKLNTAIKFTDESATFKAREMPNFDKSARNLSVSPIRIRQPTQIDKAPTLASEQRSQLRHEFNQKIKEMHEKKI